MVSAGGSPASSGSGDDPGQRRPQLISAIALCLRADARSRWRAWLGLALLIGVAAGGVTAAAVGAQRTDSAYDRFLRDHRAFDTGMIAGYCPGPDDLPEGEPPMDCNSSHVLDLPQVEDSASVLLYNGGLATADGRDISGAYSAFPGLLILHPEDDAWGTRIQRTKILAGRLASRPDEAVVGFEIAERFGLDVGDGLRLQLLTTEESQEGFEEPSLEPRELEVVGIGVSPGEIAPPSGQFLAMVQLARSFDPSAEVDVARAAVIRVRPGSTVEELGAEVARRRIAVDFGFRQEDLAVAVRRAIGPQAVALGVVALLGGIAVIAVLGQVLVRQLALDARDHRVLAELGLGRRHLVGLGVARGLVVALGASVTTVAVASLLSPLTPVGVARLAEPNPGLWMPVVPLTVAAAVTAVGVLAIAVPTAWRHAHVTRPAQARRGGRLPRLLSRLWPVPGAGLRFAFGRGSGPRAAPVASSLIGIGFGVAAATMVVVFGGGLDHLLTTPRLGGWNWDATFTFPSTIDDPDRRVDADVLSAALADDPRVESFSFGTMHQPFTDYLLRVGPDEDLVEMLSFDGASIGPTVITGRAPSGPDEILLGPETLRDVDADVGDLIEARGYVATEEEEGDVVVDMTVVGTGVIPVASTDFGGESRVGRGAVMTYEGLRRLRHEPPGSNAYDTVFLDLEPGARADEVHTDVLATIGPVADHGSEVLTGNEPVELLNIGEVDAVPRVLAILMAALAAASLVHLLLSSIGVRRGEIAVLRSIGFRPRQVREAIAWQATASMAVAVLVGIPIGVGAGRRAWLWFAEDLGVAPEAAVPWVEVGLLALGALVLANCVAALSGRRAARLAPGEELRNE